MTCVVAIAKDGKVYMGADALVSGGTFKTQRRDRKVFKVGPMVIGYCGSIRAGNLLEHKLKIPKHPQKMSDAEYMSTRFVDALRKVLIDNGSAVVNANHESSVGSFLVGYNGVIYEVDYDFHIGSPVTGYYAIGSGQDLALGSLFTTANSSMTVKSRLETALKAAEKFNTGVSSPFSYVKEGDKSDK